LNLNLLPLAILVMLAGFGAGCSGINSSQSVSPMDFFLPGAGHLLRADPMPTNAPSLFPATTTELALAK
jgi:hypothetical protein